LQKFIKELKLVQKTTLSDNVTKSTKIAKIEAGKMAKVEASRIEGDLLKLQ